MSTPALTAETIKPNIPKSQEPTKDAPAEQFKLPAGLIEGDEKKILQLAQKICDRWQFKRLGILRKVITNKEMLKGNHSVGFLPGTAQTFDVSSELAAVTGSADLEKEDADTSLPHEAMNFYQMLESAFVSALSAQLPKVRWMPADADVEEDRETARAASKIQTLLEKNNKARSQLKHILLELFTSGCYFTFTRYVVNSDLTGTHKETVLRISAAQILPPRYLCFGCGTMTPEDQLAQSQAMACPNCGQPLGRENYFQDQSAQQVPIAEKKDDVPNGQVIQTIYNPLQVDCDPEVGELRETPLLKVSEEVPKGWIKQTFPWTWDKELLGQAQSTGTDALEREYRSLVTAPAGYTRWGQSSSDKPTYTRIWVQPMAYAEDDDREFAQRLKKTLPKGFMIAAIGQDLALQIREAKLADEWTWGGAIQKGFGLFPPPVGDPGVAVQYRIDDTADIIHSYMERLAHGILLCVAGRVDARAFNNKRMQAGVLNEVPLLKSGLPLKLQDMIYQVQTHLEPIILQYYETLKHDMELLVGTPPQMFGAGTQEGVETLGGQQIQLNQSLGKVGLYWDNICDERAEAAENGVRCYQANATDDLQMVMEDETQEFINEYVHLDQIKGSVKAEPEASQQFPSSYADQKQFWQEVITSGNEQMLDWLMQEPKNIENALRFLAPPGTVAPGSATRKKLLHVIDLLAKKPPTQTADPQTGAEIMRPPVVPDKYLDDLPAIMAELMRWAEDHWSKVEQNQMLQQNLVLYYKLCVQFDAEKKGEQSMIAAQANPMAQNSNPPQPAA